VSDRTKGSRQAKQHTLTKPGTKGQHKRDTPALSKTDGSKDQDPANPAEPQASP
jgi:hypothetical protein